jgi:hypothetical protein
MTPSSHQTVRLTAGRHSGPDHGVCVMELASMLAGERFTDRPANVSPSLAAMLRGYNDGLDDDRRQTLKRFASASIGTQAGRRVERRRRAHFAEHVRAGTRPGLLTAISRRLTAASPYPAAVRAARSVSATDDDEQHARMLALFEDLIAMGRPAGAPYEDPEILLGRRFPTKTDTTVTR